MEIAIAVVGVLGTLSAALLTQMLGNRAEAERRESEDRTVGSESAAGSVQSCWRDSWPTVS
jgi:type II secretory pathway pseudopilin PulG